MFAIFCVFLLVSSSIASNIEIKLLKHWEIFKTIHKKVYTPGEEVVRRKVFFENVEKIFLHNIGADLGKHSFRLGVNAFADLNEQEFSNIYNGFKGGKTVEGSKYVFTGKKVPDTVDWRNKGLVTDVKNQGNCNSCWAFSVVAAIEGQHAKATGDLVSLSEQNLVDCSTGDYGCSDGWMDPAFQYVIDNKGIDTEDSYPYEARKGDCRFNRSTIGATIKSFVDLPVGDEEALKEAVATIGPISVAIDSSHSDFQTYSGGVYDNENCLPGLTTHAVAVVGYGHDEESGKDYWLVKNSYGPRWGEMGYIRMVRNKNNQCAIATVASYPVP